MQVFLYKMNGNKLVPHDNGDIIVIVDRIGVKVFNKNGNEITNYSFSFLGDESLLLEKLNELEKITGVKVDANYALAYPDIRSRKLKLNQLIGYVFEEYVFSILSKYYKVERNKKIYEYLHGVKIHNKPDFIVEGKIAIEAKVGDYNNQQIREYEKKFPIGAIVFPWSGNCKVNKWLCFYYFVKDPERLLKWIDFYIIK
ncbi:hypothetical protein [Sulfurisphaera ohwakuensis]|uniref:hypothetical protein n=1 Tax=Sulfurisphaera ohwakuensis TaxID=69656 RepID=UPI0036F2340B